jgi:phenylpropionate dioxygenase-like ring-hydroxylating dioxygenase large terminal subunit
MGSATTRMLTSSEAVVERLRDHIENRTTDLAEGVWHEPVDHYLDAGRFESELQVLRAALVPFCPSAAVAEPGSFLARDAAGLPVVVVRDRDGELHALRNVCRHRGAAVACGAGQAPALVCPYHGWVYRLDGRLRRAPDAAGFPDLDVANTRLAALDAFECHGLVFVRQRDAGVRSEFDELAGVVPEHFTYAGSAENEQPVNWKVLVETFLEGYHIRHLHQTTFFPIQYDNINLVERFGPNSRLTFPFRNIERDFDITDPLAVRGRLTFVYHLFPNALLVTFPGRVVMVVLEPLSVDRTNVLTYRWLQADDTDRRAAVGLVDQGAAEDFAVARTIQHGLASGTNRHLHFGRFEGAITHFHQTLDAALGQASATATIS